MSEFTNNGGKKPLLQHWQAVTALLIAYDVFAIALSIFLATWIRMDLHFGMIPRELIISYVKFMPIYAVLTVLTFNYFKLYKSIWRFASYDELLKLIMATIVTAGLHLAVYVLQNHWISGSIFIMSMVFQFFFTLGVRFSYRFILLIRGRNAAANRHIKHVMVIGAGKSGQMIIRDIKSTAQVNEKVMCIIDDNPNKKGRFIEGVEVYGNRECILEAAEKYDIDKIYLSIPSATAAQRRDILDICKETGCELMNLPGMYQFVTGEVTASKLRKVEIEDLLGREQIKVNMDEITRYLEGKTVLVTGGGGSIGSELCRQIAARNPKQLIIFDIYENNAYDIQQELIKKYPELNLVTLIGSVRDNRRIFQVFEQYTPDIAFHAAAHKHVPLMEASPCEAIKNNTVGTYNTAFAAMMHNCKKFVLISTDKAVNPTNCMGASKRSCEMIIQALAWMVRNGRASEAPQLFWNPALKKWANTPEKLEQLSRSTTEFVAVRFGNVLGSNGSVIPLFKKQIEAGGPVTVTHPDIIRYFMTIPEAVSLVLQAGTYARGGEIFVLDMGDPVKIDTLARNLIRLSGYKPDVDIKVEYTGLRPGEKLYEEKLMAEEGMRKTANDLIHIGRPIPFDAEEFLAELEPLMDAAYKNKANIKEMLAQLVSTYKIS